MTQAVVRYKLIILALLCIICVLVLKDDRTTNYSIVAQLNNPVSKKVSLIPAECRCNDKDENEYNFCYINPNNKTMIGKKFNCSHVDTLKALGLLEPTYIDLSRDEMPDPQFVTALSGNHISEGRKQLKNLHELWPKRKIIVFDMGLGQFRKEYENDPLIELRNFPFEKYPNYVRTLNQYRWKPIIIASMLKEFGAIFYMDSSIVFKDADLGPIYNLIGCKNKNINAVKALSHPKYVNNTNIDLMVKSCNKSSYLFHSKTYHSIFATTQAGTYNFLPISWNVSTTTKMYEAGMVTVVKTKEAVDNIVKWYVLCALEDKCMSPPGAALYCKFKGKNYLTAFADCHRYDQSVVNILAANYFNGENKMYGSGINGYFSVSRG